MPAPRAGAPSGRRPGRSREPSSTPRIGLPAALHLAEDLPLWESFFAELGLPTVASRPDAAGPARRARRSRARSSARPWPRCTGTCAAWPATRCSCPCTWRRPGRPRVPAGLLLLHPVRALRGVPVPGAGLRTGPACCPSSIPPARAGPRASCAPRWRVLAPQERAAGRSPCGGSARPTGVHARRMHAAGGRCAGCAAPAGVAGSDGLARGSAGPALRGARPGHEQGHSGHFRLPRGPDPLPGHAAPRPDPGGAAAAAGVGPAAAGLPLALRRAHPGSGRRGRAHARPVPGAGHLLQVLAGFPRCWSTSSASWTRTASRTWCCRSTSTPPTWATRRASRPACTPSATTWPASAPRRPRRPRPRRRPHAAAALPAGGGAACPGQDPAPAQLGLAVPAAGGRLPADRPGSTPACWRRRSSRSGGACAGTPGSASRSTSSPRRPCSTSERHGLDPARTVLWLPLLHLDLQHPHVPALHPQPAGALRRSGLRGLSVYAGSLFHEELARGLALDIALAYCFGGLLRTLSCRIRPYEREPGRTDRLLAESHRLFLEVFRGERPRERTLAEVLDRFEAVPRDGGGHGPRWRSSATCTCAPTTCSTRASRGPWSRRAARSWPPPTATTCASWRRASSASRCGRGASGVAAACGCC